MTKTFKINVNVELTQEEMIKELRKKVKASFSRGDVVWVHHPKEERKLAIVIHPFPIISTVAVDHVNIGSFGMDGRYFDSYVKDTLLTLVEE